MSDTKVYFNKVEFCLRLKEDTPTIALHKCISDPFYTYFTEDGKQFTNSCIPSMMQSLNDNFGTNYYPQACTNFGEVYTISTKTEPLVKEEFTKAEETVLDETSGGFLDLLSLDVDNTEGEWVATVSDTPAVDWDMLNSLENKKYDKIKLDEYAEKGFNIKLNQRNTLANMIEDFKEQLSIK